MDTLNTAVSFVTAVSTAALVWATWKLASLTELLTKETRLAREHAARADVQCALERDNEEFDSVEIVVKNVNNFTTKDVVVQVYSGEYVANGNNLGPFIYKVPSLLPGSHWRFYSNCSNETDGKSLSVNIKFHDGFVVRRNIVEYDLVNWHDVNIKSRQPERRIVKALEHIASSISTKTPIG